MQDFDSLDDRTVLGTLRGYRQFDLSPMSYIRGRDFHKKYILVSPSMGDWWRNGQLTASCYHDRYNLLYCRCGIYAMNFPCSYYDIVNSQVSGVIQASGKIKFGTLGFRAEKAKICALATSNAEDYNRLEQINIPDVELFTNTKAMWKAYPQDDFSSLFDKKTIKKMQKATRVWKYYHGKHNWFDFLKLVIQGGA